MWLLLYDFCLNGFLNIGGKHYSHNITRAFSLLGRLLGWSLGESPDEKKAFKSITAFLSLQHLLMSSGVFTGSNITSVIQQAFELCSGREYYSLSNSPRHSPFLPKNTDKRLKYYSH